MMFDFDFVENLIWIVNHLTALVWIILCTGVGGLLRLSFSLKQPGSNLQTWVGGLLGMILGWITYQSGALDESDTRIGAALLFLGVMSLYWFALIPNLPPDKRLSNRFLDAGLERISFARIFPWPLTLIAWLFMVFVPLLRIEFNLIQNLAWIIEHATALLWLILCAGVGGLLTPRFVRQRSNMDVDTWIGGILGIIIGWITYSVGALDEPATRLAAGAALLGVMALYWFVALPNVPQGRRERNWFLDHTLRRYRFSSIYGQFLSHVILIAWSLVVLAPLATMLMNSLKPKRDIFRAPFEWPSEATRTFDGYRSVWEDGNFDLYFKNSLIVTVGSLFLIILLGSLAAYALASWRSRYSTLVYLYFVAGLMIPIRLGTINIVTIVQDLGLDGKLIGLIPVYVAMGMPIAVFVLTAFIRGIPPDLLDAARIDGASEFRVFVQIVLPLIRPAVATVVVFNMIPIWNDLWFPLILTRDRDVRTVTYGVSLLFGQYQTDWNAILSTLSLASVPVLILYLLMSKQFIKGLTAGAIKG